MGQVGIPALQADPGRCQGEAAAAHGLELKPQPTPPSQEVVVAHPHQPWPHEKPHETGAVAAAADLAPAGVTPGKAFDGRAGSGAIDKDLLQQQEGADAGEIEAVIVLQHPPVHGGGRHEAPQYPVAPIAAVVGEADGWKRRSKGGTIAA